jgi:hypothetical protein
LVTVIVARQGRWDKLSTCCYLLDTYCLGVKETIGPRSMSEDEFSTFVQNCYSAYDLEPFEAPLELAQHLVLGAVDYARSLGFEPAEDFPRVRGHLGQMSEPCAIRFGRNGKTTYVQGPYDDPFSVMRKLDRSVGKGNYDFILVSVGDPGGLLL